MKRTMRRTKYLLLLLILFISVGYAILQSNLNITGTTGINNVKWDIHWNNVQVTTGSVSGDNVTTPATIDTNKTTVNYNITLSKPGDFYEFTVDAVNAGTIDAMIETISSKLNGTEITTLPNYLNYSVTYSDGVKIKANQELKTGTTETYKVRIEYKKDISSTDLPGTEQTLNLSFSVTYKQADDNSQAVEHAITRYTANIYDYNVTGNNTIWIGQAIPNNITQYSSAADALAALRSAASDNNIQFYLKHTIQNGIVTESYVEFVVTPEMANDNSGMTEGTYVLRGLNTFDEANDDCISEYFDTTNNICLSPYYESNKEALLQAFGSTNCSSKYNDGDYKSLTCEVSGFTAGAFSGGTVAASTGAASGGGWGCGFYDNGDSYCFRWA